MAPNLAEFLHCILKDLSQPVFFDGHAHVLNFLHCLGRSKTPSEGGHGGFRLHIPFQFPVGGLLSSRESRIQSNGSEVSSYNGLARIEKPSTQVHGDLASTDAHLYIQMLKTDEASKQLSVSEEEADLSSYRHGVAASDVVHGSTNPTERHPLQQQLENLDSVSGPVSKEVLGRATWIFLHTLAAQFPEKPTRQQQRDAKELMAILSRLYPCKECADHFKEVLKANTVQAGSGVELAQWMCMVHNVVNRSLGKPVFPCQRVDARWGALDCDGACDLQGRMH